MRRAWTIAVLLAVLTLALYWPVRSFDQIYFDDTLFVTDNPVINSGVNWHSLAWSFTGIVAANWHPLTVQTFLVTHQFLGADPGAEHLVNACLHAANAALLFWLLWTLTGATWRSAVVAGIFAWHPLRVESVAWIAERKDVLCGFFYLLSLWLYARHAQRPAAVQTPDATGQRKALDFLRVPFTTAYSLALLSFTLALLSKPMAVTLPVALVLLDVWPLRKIAVDKWRVVGGKAAVAEKWPFLALMILFCALTCWVQRTNAAMPSLDVLGLDRRVANAISSYVSYPAKLLWPSDLILLYPFPKSFDVTETVLQAALLFAVSAGCLSQLARRPWLAVGWLWYLGTALPIIGIVQVGEQGMADRYTYLPLIGPVVALVWTAADLCARARAGKIMLTATALLILSALAVLTEQQLQSWRNTVTLMEHSLAVTPWSGSQHFMLGLGLEHAGDTNGAINCYRVAEALSPHNPLPRHNLASLLLQRGQFAAAEAESLQSLAMNRDDLSAQLCLAAVAAARGQEDQQILHLGEVVRLDPDRIEALNNLAWLLATGAHEELRDGPRAVSLARRACELTAYQQTIYLGTLGAAYAEAGQFEDAIATAQRACDLATKHGEAGRLSANQKLLERYRAHRTAVEK